MPVELLSGFLRYRRAIVLGALGGVIAASWAYLWLGVGVEMEMMGLGGGHLMTMRLREPMRSRSNAATNPAGGAHLGLGHDCLNYPRQRRAEDERPQDSPTHPDCHRERRD